MPRRSLAYRIPLKQVAPRDPAFDAASRDVRAEVLRWVLVFGLEEKDRDLAAGLDKDGEKLAALAKSTIDRRHSAMGPADPNAPPLTPAHALSRTRSLLTGKVIARSSAVEFFWEYDEHTGASWGVILDAHRKGARGLPVRDVFGLGPDALGRVRQRVFAQWQAFKRGLRFEGKRKLPVPPNPSPPFVVRTVKAYEPKRSENAGPKQNRRVSQLEVNGTVYTLGASTSARGGTSAAALRRGIANGSFSGFRRHTPGGGVVPPPPPPPPQPRGDQAELRKRQAAEEARRRAAEEARRKAEEEARRKAEEARRAAEEARRKAEEEARRKAAEEEARWNAGKPILSGRPIQERIRGYTEGERKRLAVIAGADADTSVLDPLRRQKSETYDEMARVVDDVNLAERDAHKRPTKKNQEKLALAKQRLENLETEARKLAEQIREGQARIRQEATLKALAVPNPLKIHIGDKDEGINVTFNRDVKPKAEAAAAFLGKITSGREGAIGVNAEYGHPGVRANYRAWSHTVIVDVDDSVGVHVHELGHALDEQLLTSTGGKTLARSLEFLRYRVRDEVPRPMRELSPSFRDDEFGRKDHFDDAFPESSAYYIGKDYGEDATEILSMGVEQLYGNAAVFAERDPEYFKYVIGVLDGSLR
jgi:hypothetical protein